MGGLESINLEEKRAQFKQVMKNKFEPEYRPDPSNSWKLITDENFEGPERYAGLFNQECF